METGIVKYVNGSRKRESKEGTVGRRTWSYQPLICVVMELPFSTTWRGRKIHGWSGGLGLSPLAVGCGAPTDVLTLACGWLRPVEVAIVSAQVTHARLFSNLRLLNVL